MDDSVADTQTGTGELLLIVLVSKVVKDSTELQVFESSFSMLPLITLGVGVTRAVFFI